MFTKGPILDRIRAAVAKAADAAAMAEACYQLRLRQIAEGVAAEERAIQKKLNGAAKELSLELERIDRASRERVNAIQHSYSQDSRRVRDALEAMEHHLGPFAAATWSQVAPADYAPAVGLPGIVRFGALSITTPYETVRTPALLPFAGSGKNILFKASGAQAREQAARAVQSILLRLMITAQPSWLRLLLIDSVGMGNYLAPFTPSRDFLERLGRASDGDGVITSPDQFRRDMAGGKPWTEPKPIEDEIGKLSGVVEDMVQEDLRSKYANIDEFNADQGDFAKPYRVLAVINFPAGFNETSAEKLRKLCKNGPRCGAYTIMTWDPDAKLPYNFNPGDLEATSHVIEWAGNRWVWNDAEFRDAALELDQPPENDVLAELLEKVWTEARNATRTPVKFELIAPPKEVWWQSQSAGGIRVPIGVVRANQPLYFELDHKENVHVLVTGQTGSGKSNMLHMLISNLALCYPPDELSLYLIDFKEGVSFRSYASEGNQGPLPHARAIAIHSEREFGLSVLSGLVAEMRDRGKLFKSAEVEHIEQYRRARPDAKMPRILLIADEFQVFFEEDDAISQQVRMSLDQLVSQSRAAGIHLLFATQTLERTRTLPASVVGQMRVRIALKSTEPDSLTMVGTKAAYHLERQGSAIYGHEGSIDSNVRFQIPYMDKEEKHRLLAEVKNSFPVKEAPVVFDGERDALIEQSDHWRTRLAGPWPARQRKLTACLGPAVAIKPPAAAVFYHQPGRNLLVVGKDEAGGVGILSAAICDIAAQLNPENVEFHIWNLLDEESENVGAPLRLKDALRQWSPEYEVGRKGTRLIVDVAEIVKRRMEGERVEKEVFLVLFGGHRARDLGADRGRGAAFEPAPPAAGLNRIVVDPAPGLGGGAGAATAVQKQPDANASLAAILRNGPEFGVYFMGWWDSFQAVSKNLDRQAMREIGIRVALPMSRDDSRNLIDESDAGRLAAHRALLWDEERAGQLEKLIPFAPPPADWLRSFAAALGKRGW